MSFDYLFKYFIIPNKSGVGKMSIINRFCFGAGLNASHSMFYSCEFKLKTIDVGEKVIKLQIFDYFFNSKQYQLLRTKLYSVMCGIIMVYDITSIESFQELKENWYNDYLKYTVDMDVNLRPSILILGTKADLRDSDNYRDCVDADMVREFSNSINAMFFEVSSKSNINIEESFYEFTDSIKQKYDHYQLNNSCSNSNGNNNFNEIPLFSGVVDKNIPKFNNKICLVQ